MIGGIIAKDDMVGVEVRKPACSSAGNRYGRYGRHKLRLHFLGITAGRHPAQQYKVGCKMNANTDTISFIYTGTVKDN